MTGKKRSKPITEMNADELAEATAEFDKEFVIDECRPLNKEQRARWERIKRKRGRPPVGNGSKVISVSLERDLLARTDKLAKKMQVPRAQLIARGLRAVLAELER
jgi:hypothetical protein